MFAAAPRAGISQQPSECGRWEPMSALPGVGPAATGYPPQVAIYPFDPDGPGPLPEVLVAAGTFRVAGDLSAGGLAAFDGQRWAPWPAPDPDGTINGFDGSPVKLALHNGGLWALGRKGVYRWADGAWQRQPLERKEADGTPRDWNGELRSVGGELLLLNSAGGFIGGNPVTNPMILRGSEAVSLGGGVAWPGSWTYPSVSSVARLGDTWLLAGGFRQAGKDSVPTSGLAAWDGRSWTDWGGIAGWATDSVAEFGGQFYAAGQFYLAGDPEARPWHVVRRTASGWVGVFRHPADRTGANQSTTTKNGLVVLDGRLVVFGGAGVWAMNSQGEWTPLGGPEASGVYLVSGVPAQSLVRFQGVLYASGQSGNIDYHPAAGMVKLDGGRWVPIHGGLNGRVRSAVTLDGQLYVGGDFTWAHGEPMRGVARWDGERFQPLGSGLRFWEPKGLASVGPVNAERIGAARVDRLVVAGGRLYACGSFTHSGTTPTAGAAVWTGAAWEALPEAEGPLRLVGERNGAPVALVGSSAAGFPSVLLQLVEGRWLSIGTFANPAGSTTVPSVWSVTSWRGQLVVSGSFTVVDGVETGNVAALGTGRWTRVVEQPLPPLEPGAVGFGADFPTVVGIADELYGMFRGGLWKLANGEWQPLSRGRLALNGYGTTTLGAYQSQLVVAGAEWPSRGVVRVFDGELPTLGPDFPAYSGPPTIDGLIEQGKDLVAFGWYSGWRDYRPLIAGRAPSFIARWVPGASPVGFAPIPLTVSLRAGQDARDVAVPIVCEPGSRGSWFRNGVPVGWPSSATTPWRSGLLSFTGQGYSTFSLYNARPEDAGDYTLRVTTGCGSTESVVLRLVIDPQPCGPADLVDELGAVGSDGRVTNADFAAFVAALFEQTCDCSYYPPQSTRCSVADVAQTDGTPISDGCFDNGDIQAFITGFFTGCP